MSKNRAIKIVNASGGSWTTRNKAVKGIRSGRFRYIDDTTVEVIESHPGHQACIVSIEGRGSMPAMLVQSPTPEPVLTVFEDDIQDACLGQTFLHYPQPGAFGRAA